MQIHVVTAVTEDYGNMALALDLYIETEQGSEANDYVPTIERAGTVLGPAVLNFRAPVFKLGEILFLDGNDRDIITTRKPSKWDVTTERVESLDDALALSKTVRGE